MEAFLGEPKNQEVKEYVMNLQSKDSLCISANYTPEQILFSYIISKYTKDIYILSFESKDCDVQLKVDSSGRWIIDNINKKYYFVGQNSYCSYLSISNDELLPTLTCIMLSIIMDRRPFTQWELDLIKNLEKFGIIVEKNLKIPNYKQLPLFLSLMLSLDPFIPSITGNRENAIKIIKEVNLNEISKLEDLNENQLNTLLFKIISLITKENVKFARDDIITDRIYYLDYDTLELAFSALYAFDVIGTNELLQLVLSPSYAEILENRYKQKLSKGFSLNLIDSKQSYYLIEAKNFESPLIAQLVFLQLQKIRRDKMVVLKIGDELYTSRYFINSKKEGLIKLDNGIKDSIKV
ncbi:MAG: single-stranded DNA exonuclease [Saccharolobus sp.]